MFSFIAKNGEIETIDEDDFVVEENSQISLASLKFPTDVRNYIRNGMYRISIFNVEKNIQKDLNNVELTSNENFDWFNFNHRWVNFDVFKKCVVFLRTNNDKKYSLSDFEQETSLKIQYRIFIKSDDDDGGGSTNLIFEPTISYCEHWSSTVKNDGSRTTGASCPINPDTGKEFSKCLNWRRRDYIGKKCRKIMNKKQIQDSIFNFCEQNKNAEDCECVKRFDKNNFKHENYLQKQKSDKKIHAYCWYSKCNEGRFLIKNEGNNFNCGNKKCKINYYPYSKTPFSCVENDATNNTNSNNNFDDDDNISSDDKNFIKKNFYKYKNEIYIFVGIYC